MRDKLADLIRPGSRVALGDGYGAPRSASAALSAAAARAGGVRLVLGWVPAHDPDLDLSAFADVRAVMGGWGLRKDIDSGAVHYVPTRLGTIPALIHGPLRPDVLVTSLVRVPGGYAWGSEVSWMRAAVDAGAVIAGVLRSALPHADAGAPLPEDRVVIVDESAEPPLFMPPMRDSPAHADLGRRAATVIPEGARVQVGPGPLGAALLASLQAPVRIDSGMLPEAIVDLDRRGLLIGEPMATYLTGSSTLFAWADGRPILQPIEVTHDPGRLSNDTPLIAINTALEIDDDGQVNVEGTASSNVGGIGGHPDFAAAGTRSIGGLSIVATPTQHQGRSTKVRQLARPVSTPAHDVDIVVTERGTVDLRGLDRPERRAALASLWGER
ncbi:MAG TPA: acetyl-CoA hydrolase/transferase C-terminal domain-containing protein [Mycobacteriales bacterium]|jgi:acyl-CoA hydrolase|nr:acetyl-CoA hydrolase/transferase C-terminal domain-containing protein [Mycobacteriales bacterium]